MFTSLKHRRLSLAVAFAFLLVAPARALAHCDALDGPVVKAAQKALDARDPAFALVWVQKADEAEIRHVFAQTLAVRELGAQARELADRHFFETLVRVHRAGEGAPFTGLKPAGGDVGPAIPAADAAVRTGAVEPVLHLLTGAVQANLRERFARVLATKAFSPRDVEAGRKHVEAYVAFLHAVERIYEAAKHSETPHDSHSR